MMRRLPGCLLILAVSFVSAAHGVEVSVGGSAGASIPIVQDDNTTGFHFGFRVPVQLSDRFALEPYFSSTNGRETTHDFAGVEYIREGLDTRGFGGNLMVDAAQLGTVHIQPYAGIGAYHLSRIGTTSGTHAGYVFGLALAVPTSAALQVDVRGEFDMVVTGDTSRKFALITAGLQYRFYSTP